MSFPQSVEPAGRKRTALLIVMIIVTGMLLTSCGAGGGGNGDSGCTDCKTHTVSGLNPGAIYHWAVVAKDNQGAETQSNVWSFTTR